MPQEEFTLRRKKSIRSTNIELLFCAGVRDITVSKTRFLPLWSLDIRQVIIEATTVVIKAREKKPGAMPSCTGGQT